VSRKTEPNKKMQYLTLCALLLCVLSVAHCENITKLTTHAIRHPNEVLYATTEVWYRSAKNEAVRLSHPDQRLPLPEPLLSFETMFLELSNNRVLMYAVGSNTSTPFYVTDGVSITQYYARSPGVPNTLKKMEYTISHGNDYVIGVFENQVQGYLNYTAICTSLNTSNSVILPYALTVHGAYQKLYFLDQLLMQPTTNGFYMAAMIKYKYQQYLLESSQLIQY
jgi:hypothetical protein